VVCAVDAPVLMLVMLVEMCKGRARGASFIQSVPMFATRALHCGTEDPDPEIGSLRRPFSSVFGLLSASRTIYILYFTTRLSFSLLVCFHCRLHQERFDRDKLRC
jgi:hypothetical protein